MSALSILARIRRSLIMRRLPLFLVLSIGALLLAACSGAAAGNANATATASVLNGLPTPATLPTRPSAPPTATAVPVLTPPLATNTPTPIPPVPSPTAATLNPNLFPGAYVTAGSAAILSTPGGQVVGRAQAGERFGILARQAGWLQIAYQPDPARPAITGWVAASSVTVFADLDAIVPPTTDANPTPATPATPNGVGPYASVVTDRLNLRAGPGVDQRVIRSLERGEQVQLLGRSDDSSWLRVQTADGVQGWAATRYLQTEAKIADLPVAGKTTASAPGSSPAVASAQGHIVFQTKLGGDIYIINANGAGLRRLTSGIEPALSPDGRTVAFMRWDAPAGVFLIDIDGANERRIYTENRPRSPRWLPDGSGIIFEYNTVDVFCRDTPIGCFEDEAMRRYFGGKDCGSTPFGYFCINDFSLITAQLTNLLRYTLADSNSYDLETTRRARSPDLRPNSDQVVYVDNLGLGLATLRGGSQPVMLYEDTGLGSPAYSRDGRFIYAGRRSGDHWDIWRWPADGGEPVALTAPPGLRDAPVHNVSPAVSPDGNTILFLTNRRGKWEFWLMNADGGNQRAFAPQALASIILEYNFNQERMASWQ